MSYVQTFNLVPDAGSYFVQNDVFRCTCWTLRFTTDETGDLC